MTSSSSARHAAAALLSALLLAPCARPANFSFTGDFRQDDEHRVFSLTLSKPGNLTIRTLSYAGGVDAAGVTIPAGGFDPTLSLFDSTGAMIGLNRDGGCPNVTPDPVTQYCWDSLLALPLPAGTYRAVLTESENVPFGPTFSDPFTYDGTGDFTAAFLPASNGASPTGFWDFGLHSRSSAYEVDILGADSAQLGVTTAVSALVNSASGTPGQISPNDILSYYDPGLTGGAVTVTVGGVPAAVLYSGAGQINFVIPGDLPPGTAELLTVSHGPNLLFSTTLNAIAVNPALFADNGQGIGEAAILNQDYSVNSASDAAARGSYISVYGTGFGAVLPPGSDGLSRLASGVTATIGGVMADVVYAGLSPGSTPGLQQINIQVPPDAPTGPSVSIQLTISGSTTQTGTTVAVK